MQCFPPVQPVDDFGTNQKLIWKQPYIDMLNIGCFLEISISCFRDLA